MTALGRFANVRMSMETEGNTHVGTRSPGLNQSAGAGESEDDRNAFSSEESIVMKAGGGSISVGRRWMSKGNDLLVELRKGIAVDIPMSLCEVMA